MHRTLRSLLALRSSLLRGAGPTPRIRWAPTLWAACLGVGLSATLPAGAQVDGCASGDEVPIPQGLEATDVPSGSIRRAETSMGTTLALGASGVGCEEATEAFQQVFAEFHRVEVMVSLEHADSELAKVNAAAGGDPVVVSDELFGLIQWAVAMAEDSQGAFDPTFAAMDGLWKFERRSAAAETPDMEEVDTDDQGADEAPAGAPALGPVPSANPPTAEAGREAMVANVTDAAGVKGDAPDGAVGNVEAEPVSRVPSDEAIATRKKLVDYRQVLIDPLKKTVQLKQPGMVLSLGGIAKGYATDRAVQLLRGRGFKDFIIRSSGEMFIEGNPGGGNRRIGIPDPRGKGAFALLDVKGRALNISQDSKRFFIEDGVRYHHIIDPRTGRPAQGTRTVAVTAPDATTADALSTAVFVLGAQEGLKLVEDTAGAEAIVVDSDNRVFISSGFGPRLTVRPPTADE